VAQVQVEFLGDGLSHNHLALLVQVEFLAQVEQGTHAMVKLLQEQVILAQLVQVAIAVQVQQIIGERQVVLQTMLALARVVEVAQALMVAMAFQVVVVLAMEPLVLEQTLVATVVLDLQAVVVELH
jgi:hypothetical protein